MLNKSTAVIFIPLTLYTMACVITLLLCSTSSLVLGLELPHTLRVSIVVTLLVYSSVGAAALRPNNIWSLLPIQKIHHRDYIDGITLNAKVSGAWQKLGDTSKVCLHYTSHDNSVQTWYQMETNTQTNPHIQDAGQTGICQ